MNSQNTVLSPPFPVSLFSLILSPPPFPLSFYTLSIICLFSLSLFLPPPPPTVHTTSGGASSPRKTLLHNIDPLWKPRGKRHPDYAWDTRVRAALRSGDYKVITGDPGPGKWIKPPGTKGRDEPENKGACSTGCNGG